MLRIANATGAVMQFDTIMGQDCKATEYTSHSNTPVVNMLYMGRLMPLTSLVLKVCQACGIKLRVVSTAATLPMISIVCIGF